MAIFLAVGCGKLSLGSSETFEKLVRVQWCPCPVLLNTSPKYIMYKMLVLLEAI